MAKVRARASTSIRIKNYTSSTHLVLEVSGYDVEQIQATVGTSGTLVRGSSRVLSATLMSPGVYHMEIDRQVASCSGTVSGFSGPYIATLNMGGSAFQVRLYTASGTPVNWQSSFHILC